MMTACERAGLLIAAALAGHEETLRNLLPACGDPAEDGLPIGGACVTPLMAAAVAGREAAVVLLLTCGADPARRDPQGRTAAWYARSAGHHHLAERLDTVVDKERMLR
jgi:hypothetical protein